VRFTKQIIIINSLLSLSIFFFRHRFPLIQICLWFNPLLQTCLGRLAISSTVAERPNLATVTVCVAALECVFVITASLTTTGPTASPMDQVCIPTPPILYHGKPPTLVDLVWDIIGINKHFMP
jgi:hypothetical protein